MESKEFIYWLQGYVEITGGQMPTPEQWLIICDHLKLCFKKETPVRLNPSPSIDIKKGGYPLINDWPSQKDSTQLTITC